MRGYFAIGTEQISKPMNLGNLIRSAHAFGASFFFTIAPVFAASEVRLSDTSDAAKHLPLYNYDSVGDLALPRGCALIGVELSDDAVELPSFHHPGAAAYVFGPERGELSPEIQARCQQLVKIPTKFSVNVGIDDGVLSEVIGEGFREELSIVVGTVKTTSLARIIPSVKTLR